MNTETEYNLKFKDYCDKIQNDKFIFEITKLCGYGEFLVIYKKQTLLDLYKMVSMQFESKDVKELFFMDSNTIEKIRIPITNEITIWEFIFSKNNGTNQSIKPVYPIPCKIVYKIYFDDGHTHGNNPCEQNKNLVT